VRQAEKVGGFVKTWEDLSEADREKIGSYYTQVKNSDGFRDLLFGAASPRVWYGDALDRMVIRDLNGITEAEFGEFLIEEITWFHDDWLEQPSDKLSRHQVLIEVEQRRSELRALTQAMPY